jgi:membrane protease YdiL (CAAX protease family)
MSRFSNSIALQGLFSGDNFKPTFILLYTPLLLTAWKYYGSVAFYNAKLSQSFVLFDNPELTGEYFHFASAFLMLGLFSLLIIKIILKENLSDYGLGIGDWRFGLKAFALLAPILILSTYPSSKMPDFRAEYPFFKDAGLSPTSFVVHASMYVFYYIGWEIFFRGMMQFGLRKTFGDWNTVLIQTIASCLVHIGKPDGEIFSSILGGIAWGVIAFRTNSIWYVFLMHWLLGVSLDFFICYG